VSPLLKTSWEKGIAKIIRFDTINASLFSNASPVLLSPAQE
jgi:hypothetical protein